MLAIVLLILTALVCVSLGRWQLRRADERIAMATSIQDGRQSPPIRLTANTPPDLLQAWRPAVAEGRWLDQFAVWLDNRNLEGRPGLWLAMPLQLADSPDTAVLVLRGWAPRAMGAAMPTLPPTADSLQQVHGELRTHVPQLFELWQRDGRDHSALPQHWQSGSPPLVQNLELSRLAQATGLKLLPIVLEQADSAPPSHDQLVRDWPTPSVDADKNHGYALQWFGFAAIAVGACLWMLWRAWRPRRRQA